MKNFLKKIIPNKILGIYHYLLAFFGAVFFGFPSRKMIIIGITGTKGKTSTANFIWSVLENSGIKTGILTTANFRIGKEEFKNPFHMTMLGRFKVQKFLNKMQKSGCKVAIVETTSQGIAQYRHIGIDYDMAVFTNLTPEHIDSHGSFENYKKAKGVLFESIQKSFRKKIDGKEVQKIILANIDDENSKYFLGFGADKKITFSLLEDSDYHAQNIEDNASGVSFDVKNIKYYLAIVGKFNIYNALPAIAIGEVLELSTSQIKNGLEELSLIAGRMEEIKMGQNFRVFVDYAHEKESMKNVLEAARKIAGKNKVLVILGADGGGRDKAKGREMGEIAGQLADIVIASTTDPYDDDPLFLAEIVAEASEKAGKKREENLFVIVDRREGIMKALSLAQEGDVIILTGMGAQQTMIVKGKELPWDDGDVVREELGKLIALS